MRVRLSFTVSDSARRYIALLLPDAARTKDGMARSVAVERYINEHLAALNDASLGAHFGPLTEREAAEVQEAVSYLRAQGRSDSQIRAWLLVQRARLHFSGRAPA